MAEDVLEKVADEVKQYRKEKDMTFKKVSSVCCCLHSCGACILVSDSNLANRTGTENGFRTFGGGQRYIKGQLNDSYDNPPQP